VALVATLALWTAPGTVTAQVGVTETAADGPKKPVGMPGSIPVSFTNRPEDEKAVLAVGETFRKLFAAGDAKGVAALYAENAEIIDEVGDRIVGRPAIQEAYAALFQTRKGATIEIKVDSLRFLDADTAKEEGSTTVKLAQSAEPPAVRQYTVLFTKQGEAWRYASVREEVSPALSHHDRLAELEWMIGDWVDENSESVVHATCKWSPDKNFLLREFTVQSRGTPVMTVHQRIGWDPLTKQIKSWVFDSEGGYGEGFWTRSGTQWMIKSTGVLPDGRVATATNILTRTGPNSAKWASIERTIGGEHTTDKYENLIVRRPPPYKPEAPK
jgi:uncharacterized protein (TIGR02246 family)